jgi:hypothetical protein
VAHAFNPIQKAEIKSEFNASLGKKLVRLISQQINWAWWCTPVIPATQEVNRRTVVKDSPEQNARPYLKNN